ncbi:MAG: hypothetical protein LBT24_06215, partial [Tannerella sp.]|jgi:hypothetical protein|nr:hypothetical protein [Tannerella sp.]
LLYPLPMGFPECPHGGVVVEPATNDGSVCRKGGLILFLWKGIKDIALEPTPNGVKKTKTCHSCCFAPYFCTIKTKAKWKKISL